jgi:hypothetical protein
MSDQGEHRFDEAFKAWASAEPDTPARKAARQVMARLPERRPQRWFADGWLPVASVAAGLALMLAVGWTLVPRAEMSEVSAVETLDLALPPLQENVVLLWLDEQTPLYLTVAPPATEGGS